MYASGADNGKQELVWVTRDGKAQAVDPDWQGTFYSPSLSPDGNRLAVVWTPSVAHDPTYGGRPDIWIKQLDRGPSIKLTLDGKENYSPTWTPDGKSVTYGSNASGFYDLWTKRADGSAQAVRQLHYKTGVVGSRWSPDGKWLVFRTDRTQAGAGDILGIRPGALDTVAVPLVATRFSELTPALSPNGRCLAYASNESGQFETYVVPFPNTTAAKWAISTRGGTEPLWSHSGQELFYRDGPGNLVSVEVETSPTFAPGRSTALFPAAGLLDLTQQQFAVARDDKRFLMIRPVPTTGSDKLIVVDNWFEELKAKSRK